MDKRAPADHPIDDLVAARWSPYVFRDETLEAGVVASLLEAARWAPSSYNEQPWRFLVGRKGDAAWQGIHDCLVEPNQAWAQAAPVLMVSVASMRYARGDKPNAHAWHDVGLATGNLLAEATARGLLAHQMGGFFPDRLRERFGLPEHFEPCAAIAIGHRGDPATAAPELAAREQGPRTRRAVAEFAFGDSWGQPASLDA
ncbi:MAG: nitroreductase family protein [Planctomycetota bacterium]|nr:nitroreductase family protein [Planctomycetota bacterium]